ncbi:MAG: phosphoribosylformylglycinamidine cyclo-ligase [Proteobacteria bacterium]|nr:phosphoribosylformylglycinamidine cyclo-ligase [Pseudomonadota bacterium]
MTQANSSSKKPLSYKDAGVDIDAGDQFIDRIKPFAKSTMRAGCLGGLGGFGALFEIPDSYEKPVLVSGTDGVGTKLKLAFDSGIHNSIGIDLVGMCVNDVLVQGAEPLFFLDYFATGKLSPQTGAQVVEGIAEGCLQSGAALIGGETAEMPGMYSEGEYDLAGFCVGAVEKSRIIDGSKVSSGDVLIGLPSTGPHSNGYSLIRKVIERSNANFDMPIDGKSLLEHVMAPTRIYVKPILKLLEKVDVHALAHITGGGIPGNLVRVLPDHCHAVIKRDQWEWPTIFDWLKKEGNIDQAEMYRTFNCGLGMILIVAANDAEATIANLESNGQPAMTIGELHDGDNSEPVLIR